MRGDGPRALPRASARAIRNGGISIDGDGGDENLKDYPIEENPELTIRSVINNPMLYQEGWGVGRIKHSLTYSGGLSRGYVRTYAPARRYGFDGFSPFTRPHVIEVAEGIPFVELTELRRGDALRAQGRDRARAASRPSPGFEMPVFPKRRFQHGALPADAHARAARRRRAARIAARSTPSTRKAHVASYPASAAERDRFVLDARSAATHVHDPWRPKASSSKTSAPRTATSCRVATSS